MPQSGDGFISGHAAISAALAAGVVPVLPGATPVLAALAGTVGFSRLYVGAHLPLDVVGGAALGSDRERRGGARAAELTPGRELGVRGSNAP